MILFFIFTIVIVTTGFRELPIIAVSPPRVCYTYCALTVRRRGMYT